MTTLPSILKLLGVHVLLRGLRGLWSGTCGILLLAVLASVPVLQIAVLGYFLELSGRMAREGRWSAGLIGWQQFADWGRWVLGTAAVMAPLVVWSRWQYLAYLVNADGREPLATDAIFVLGSVIAFIHLTTAWLAGGKWQHFLWPLWFPLVLVRLWRGRRAAHEWFPPAMCWHRFRQGQLVRSTAESLWENIRKCRLVYYVWLGLRGLIGTLLWLWLPVLMMALAFEAKHRAGGLLGVLGGVGYGLVILYLPFLQTAMAASGRWQDMFRVGEVRRAYGAAPIAMLTAWLATFSLTLPLYLLKIEYTPQELSWLPAILFVSLALPGRWLAGWAWYRARHRNKPSHLLVRWFSGVVLLAATALYTLLVYLTQYVAWNGTWSLLEQPALLLPVPFWMLR